jgi:hypothetical protein
VGRFNEGEEHAAQFQVECPFPGYPRLHPDRRCIHGTPHSENGAIFPLAHKIARLNSNTVSDHAQADRRHVLVCGGNATWSHPDAAGCCPADCKPTLVYLQSSRDTFLELAPATAERPAGLSHIRLWPEDLNATVAGLQLRGVQVGDPRTGSTKPSITNAIDPNGVRLELLDFLPDSLPKKAMDAWKQREK